MSISETERPVLEALDRLGIPFRRLEHPPVATVAAAERHWAGLRGVHCKNLFLRNKKGNHHYLVVAPASKPVDLRALNAALGEDRLSFASPERLSRCLGLEPGSVSPFGLINDAEKSVRVVVDKDLAGTAFLGFHPNTNTATLEISGPDFERFLEWTGHRVTRLAL